MKPDTSFVLKSGHFHLLTTFPDGRQSDLNPRFDLQPVWMRALVYSTVERSATCPESRLPCKSKSRKKHEASGRAPESAHCFDQDSLTAHMCLSAGGSCSLQNRTSICCLGLEEPSQMIEFVFSASPETIRRGLGSLIPRPVGYRRDLAACAFDESRCFCLFLYRKGFYAAAVRLNSLGRHEVLLPALYGEHVADHLPGNSQRGPVPISSLQFSGVDQGEFVRLVWAPAWQLRSALAGYACSAAWKSACASPCRLSSSHHRTSRSS